MMPKDLKIGLLLGVVLVTAIMLWLATSPSLITKTGGSDSRSNVPPQEDHALSNNFSTNGLTAQDTEVTQSKPPNSRIYREAEKIKTQKFHIVREGDTLSEISRKYYGSVNKWRMILKANQSVIEDVNRLRPGTKLIIPD
jgi:nucleoid-associated protein YgaU